MWVLCKGSSLVNTSKLICVGDYFLKYEFPTRFQKDCCYYDDGKMQFLVEGVLFNKHDVLGLAGEKISDAASVDSFFFKQLNGVFSGFAYYHCSNELVVFSCQNGLDNVFYFTNEGGGGIHLKQV